MPSGREIWLAPCEMPAGVRGFISFHFPRKRKISQWSQIIISHPKDISLHIPSFLLYNQMGKAVLLCLRPSFVNFQLILQSKLLGYANDQVPLFAGKPIGVLWDFYQCKYPWGTICAWEIRLYCEASNCTERGKRDGLLARTAVRDGIYWRRYLSWVGKKMYKSSLDAYLIPQYRKR